jgi:hypothetical protein
MDETHAQSSFLALNSILFYLTSRSSYIGQTASRQSYQQENSKIQHAKKAMLRFMNKSWL